MSKRKIEEKMVLRMYFDDSSNETLKVEFKPLTAQAAITKTKNTSRQTEATAACRMNLSACHTLGYVFTDVSSWKLAAAF